MATWSGFAYVAFVTGEFSRRIVGWRVASWRPMCCRCRRWIWPRGGAGGDLAGIVHHADHESNYLAVVYTDRIVELGARPSTGSIDDSYEDRTDPVSAAGERRTDKREGTKPRPNRCFADSLVFTGQAASI